MIPRYINVKIVEQFGMAGPSRIFAKNAGANWS
jgi:hypothetical protein